MLQKVAKIQIGKNKNANTIFLPFRSISINNFLCEPLEFMKCLYLSSSLIFRLLSKNIKKTFLFWNVKSEHQPLLSVCIYALAILIFPKFWMNPAEYQTSSIQARAKPTTYKCIFKIVYQLAAAGEQSQHFIGISNKILFLFTHLEVRQSGFSQATGQQVSQGGSFWGSSYGLIANMICSSHNDG